MWLVIIFGLAILASYGGMPESIAGIVRMTAAVGLVASIIGCFVGWRKDEKRRRNEKPRLEDYHYNHYNYKQALRKWEITKDPKLATLSLLQRLEQRGHCRSRGYYGDNLHHSVCFVCGKSMGDNEDYCTECYGLYQRSPKKPLPNGIPETCRYLFWEYEQAIVIDVQKGLISEEQARRELREVAEQIKIDIATRNRIEAQNDAIRQARDRKLLERQALAERLSPK